MRGQVSTELLMIIALILLIFIPLLVLVYVKAGEANQQIGSYQAELTVSRVASLANSVGSLGTDTSVITDVYIPPNTVSFETINTGGGGEIILRVETNEGPTEIVDIIRYPISNPDVIADDITAGSWIRVRISSDFDNVNNQAQITIEKMSA